MGEGVQGGEGVEGEIHIVSSQLTMFEYVVFGFNLQCTWHPCSHIIAFILHPCLKVNFIT